jgi:glycerophosphoryl diester phosphodiesterase
MKDKFTPIAHRGGNEVAPENTLASFKDSYELGYRWLETDVRISKNKVLYAFHDDKLDRILGKSRRLSELNSWDIDELSIEKKYRIPRFEMLANEFSDAIFNVDAKSFEAGEVLVDLINSKKVNSNLCLASFHQATIQYMRKNIKRDIESAFSSNEVIHLLFNKIMQKEVKFEGKFLQIPIKYFGVKVLTKNLIKYCKSQEIKIHVWTINDEKTMTRLIELGVDGIMTDKCRILLKALERKISVRPSQER